MTVLGKILAFVNLAFSVLTAALVIFAYTTRTNWKAGYDDARKKLDVAQAVLSAERQAASQELQRKDEQVKAAQTAAREKDARIAALEDESKMTKGQLAAATKLREDETTTKGLTTAELERIRQERLALEKEREGLRGRLKDTTNQMVTFRDQAVSNEIRYKSEHERNLRLLEQVAALNQQLARAKDQGGAGAAASEGLSARTPAPQSVRGTVTATDGQSNLATISIGSDAGLVKNNVLRVYRLRPSPAYLGTLTILNTRPHEAVGRYDASQKRLPLQVGDEVASEILTSAANGR